MVPDFISISVAGRGGGGGGGGGRGVTTPPLESNFFFLSPIYVRFSSFSCGGILLPPRLPKRKTGLLGWLSERVNITFIYGTMVLSLVALFLAKWSPILCVVLSTLDPPFQKSCFRPCRWWWWLVWVGQSPAHEPCHRLARLRCCIDIIVMRTVVMMLWDGIWTI